MKENFIIREERHPSAKAIEAIATAVGMICFGLAAIVTLFGFCAGVDNLGIGIAVFLASMMGWTFISQVIYTILNLAVKEYYIGGFDVAGLRVNMEVSHGIVSRDLVIIKDFVVNDKSYGKHKTGVEAKVNGHELGVVILPAGFFRTSDVQHLTMTLDDEVIVENGFVYVDKIEQILSGGVASSTQVSVASAPRAIDTGVMPPFQTFPSRSNEEKTVAPRTISYAIVGQAGVFESKKYDVASMLVLGRDEAECSVTFPSNTAGVSRVHCKLVVEADGLYVYDLGSTYGTVVNNNKTLSANQKMRLNHGDTITIGSNQTFVVKEM